MKSELFLILQQRREEEQKELGMSVPYGKAVTVRFPISSSGETERILQRTAFHLHCTFEPIEASIPHPVYLEC